MKYKHVRASALAAAAVVVGLLSAVGAAGAAVAADETIVGEGRVTLDFSVTPGSVAVQVWTKNLSEVEAWGRAVVFDVDGTAYPFGARHYAPGEEYVFARTLAGYTCDDLGSASAVAYGFSGSEGGVPDWTSGTVRHPDARITVIGCDPAPPNPTDGGQTDPEPTDPEPTDTTTPTTSKPTTTAPTATTPTARKNTLPPAKTDGSLLAEESPSSPLFGLLVTAGVIVAAATVRTVTGALRRR